MSTPFNQIDYDNRLNSMMAHLEKHVGPFTKTIQSETNEAIINILIVQPTKEKNFYTLVTCSASKNPSRGANEELMHVEFTICLPADWPLPLQDKDLNTSDNKAMFPLWLLQNTVHFHLFQHELSPGHTMTGKQEPDFPQIASFLVHFPIMFGVDFSLLDTETPGMILGIYPLHQEEYKFLKKNDSDALLDKLTESGVNLVFDSHRKDICRKKFFFF